MSPDIDTLNKYFEKMQQKSNQSKDLIIQSKTIDFYDHTDSKISNSKIDYKGLAALENY